MTTRKRLLTLLAVVSLVLSMIPVMTIAAAEEEELFDLSWADPDNEDITILEADELTELEKEALVQIPAIKASEALGDYFLSIGYTADEIPECYGGAYINDQQQLVIKITAGHQEICDGIREAMPFDASFVIEETDISLIELMFIQEEVTALYKEGITTNGISQKDSVVDIGIAPEYSTIANQLSFSTFRSDISSYVRFHIDTEHPQTTASLIGGNPLYTNDKKWFPFGTLGFCGTFIINGKRTNCVLTAGHLVKGQKLFYGINNPVNNNTSNSIVQYEANKTGDYALIPAGQNTLTNLVRLNANETAKINLSHIVEPIFSDFEGRQVLKYGIITGLTAGEVSNINLGVEYEVNTDPNEYFDTKIKINGLASFSNTKINKLVEHGDSGGPVWYFDSSGKRVLCGVISGKLGYKVAYYSRIQYPHERASYIPTLN